MLGVACPAFFFFLFFFHKVIELVRGGPTISSFGSGTSLLWIIEESAGEGLCLLALLTGGR